MPSATPPGNGPFTLRPLTADDAPLVQELLEASPDYTLRTQGRPVEPGDGTAVLTALPPGLDPGAKTVVGLLDATGSLLALLDALHGWPEPETVHIGLLLVREDAQGAGLGRLLHATLLAQLRRDSGIRRLRAGIVSTNADVGDPFWTRMGYRATGEVHPHEPPAAPTGSGMTTAIWERDLVPSASGPHPTDQHRGPAGLHHLELWTADLARTGPAWGWLLTTLGWTAERIEGWDLGRIWRHRDGSYLVLEQSEDVAGDRSDRLRPGMNHLALSIADRARLDVLREQATEHGWTELFAERYPHAGGDGHAAWYAEDPEGIEIEIVAPYWPG